MYRITVHHLLPLLGSARLLEGLETKQGRGVSSFDISSHCSWLRGLRGTYQMPFVGQLYFVKGNVSNHVWCY